MPRNTALSGGILATAFVATVAFAQAPVPDWSNAQTIDVVMTNFAYAPKTIRLQHGMPYRLHLVNNASGGHSFEARQFFESATIAPEDSAKVIRGDVNVPSGGAVDVRVVPGAAASYPVRCSHFLHPTFGMTGDIVVE